MPASLGSLAILTATVLLGVLLVCFTIIQTVREVQRRRSLGYQQDHGHWRVLYPNGSFSQPFNFTTAQDYAKDVGGTVVLKSAKPEPKTEDDDNYWQPGNPTKAVVGSLRTQ